MPGRAPLSPARLEPIFSPRPWGARNLAPLFPDKSNLAEPLGEAWLTGDECRFASGPYSGTTLGEAWPTMSAEWTGTHLDSKAATFPLLVKFLFSREKLSVQVHPDDAYASAHEKAAGGRGKTEMWYVIHAEPSAEVLVGLKPEVTKESFRRAIGDASVEDSLHHVPLLDGEAIFVPAGTVHTLGVGFVLCEIQQSSDLTYRVYDYGRRDAAGKPRELHLDKAFDVTRFGPQLGGKIAPASIDNHGTRKTFLAACPYFATERWQFAAPIASQSSPEHFELWIVIEGSGSLRWSGESEDFAPAQVWMIPAGLGRFELAPKSSTTILRTFVPSSPAAVAADWTRQGITKSDAARLVFP
ncbi:MAG TPA: type I phosphomannose isomerase catalytic subunit [Candidatus Acidoferrales bacterium]